jgi:hypothetical protein
MKLIFKPPIWVVLTALLCLHSQVKAQEEEKEQKIKRYEWEIMTNPIYIFYPLTSGQSIPAMIMVRKHTEQIKKKALVKSAYRFRLNLSGSAIKADSLGVLNLPSGGSVSIGEGIGFQIGVAIGKEWQKQIGKFQIFYGTDIHVGYDKNEYKYPQTPLSSQIWNNEIKSFGINPLIGVKYFLNARFAFSLESALSAIYVRRKSLDGWRQLNYSSYSAYISPVYNFNFSYHF